MPDHEEIEKILPKEKMYKKDCPEKLMAEHRSATDGYNSALSDSVTALSERVASINNLRKWVATRRAFLTTHSSQDIAQALAKEFLIIKKGDL